MTTRDALLDAAWDTVVAHDWERARMLDVATRAGVSRQTLYNEFGSKDQLAQALALREAQRFLDGIAAAVDAAAPARPALATRAAVEFTLTAAADNPLLKSVLTDDDGLLPLVTTRAGSLMAMAREHMATQLFERWPQLDADKVRFAAEIITRLTISYLVLPADGDDATAAATAARISRTVDHLLPTISAKTVTSRRQEARP